MLEPEERILYHRMLLPPAGFRTDFALATTYSLDLSALLMSAFALDGQSAGEGQDHLTDPIAGLKALRDLNSRCIVFCQHDRILVPRYESGLFGFFRQVVVPVMPDRKGSFHPKIWLVRYVRDDAVTYRIACLSRNLTFDTSWDTALIMDSKPKRWNHGLNSGLAALLGSLLQRGKRQIHPDSRKKIRMMVHEIPDLQWEIPGDFRWQPEFINMKGLDFIEELSLHRAESLLLVSPFLSSGILEKITGKVSGKTKLHLVSRRESLDALRTENRKKADAILHRFATVRYVRDDILPEGEGHAISGLHAKMLLLRLSNEVTRLYTGSANATSSGMGGRNDEFMTKIPLAYSDLTPEDFLDGKKGALFAISVPYDLSLEPEPADEAETAFNLLFESVRKWFLEAEPQLNATGDGAFPDISLGFFHAGEAVQEGLAAVGVRILGSKDNPEIELDLANPFVPCAFGPLPVALVCPFLAVRVVLSSRGTNATRLFVLKVDIHGLPEAIESVLFRHFITDQEQFLRYLMLLLGGEGPASFSGSGGGGGSSSGAGGGRSLLPSLTAEDLLSAFVRDRSIFDRIRREILLLEEAGHASELIPEELRAVLKEFEKAADNGG